MHGYVLALLELVRILALLWAVIDFDLELSHGGGGAGREETAGEQHAEPRFICDAQGEVERRLHRHFVVFMRVFLYLSTAAKSFLSMVSARAA